MLLLKVSAPSLPFNVGRKKLINAAEEKQGRASKKRLTTGFLRNLNVEYIRPKLLVYICLGCSGSMSGKNHSAAAKSGFCCKGGAKLSDKVEVQR